MKRRPFTASGDLAMRPEAVGLTWPQSPCESTIVDGIAVVSISGPLTHENAWWFESYQSILERVQGAVEDPEVGGVMLRINSPGGEVSGLQETVRRIRDLSAESGKPIYAYADEEAYSAAYAIACAASKIFMPESGGVGSVGVLATMCERTKMTEAAGLRIEVIRSGEMKAEGHPDIPLTDDAIGRVQARVDALAAQFFELVTEARPTSPGALEALAGRLVFADDAVEEGLADDVCSFAEAMAQLASALPEGFDTSGSRVIESQHAGSAQRGTLPEEEPMNLKALEAAVSKALAAMHSATTPKARASAVAAYTRAISALNEATVKKSWKKTTRTEEEETDDGDEEKADDEDAEDEKRADDEGSEDEKKSEGTDEKKSKRAAKPPPDDKKDDDPDDDDDDDGADDSKKSIAALVQKITGKTGAAAQRGVLTAMKHMADRVERAESELAKVRGREIAATKNALIDELVATGRITPSQKAWAQGETIASLKAYRAATPARTSPRPAPMPGAPVEQGGTDVAGADGLTAAEREICRVSGVSVEAFKKARESGVTIPKVN